jgi:hypothetical protein
MSARSKESEGPLTRAAVTLETELLHYEQGVKELGTTAITSEKSLHRARIGLERCAELERRLGAALQSFAEAMQETQNRQQQYIATSREAAERVQQRFNERNALLERMKVLGEHAKELNEPVAAAMTAGSEEASPTSKLLSSLEAVGERTASVIDEADALQRAARDDEWLDIERETGTLKQQLQSARNKVLIAHRNVAGRSPS